ncbi:serine/threonine-protein kinase [Mycobacterium nebraskense]|uniref:non-specific serine/threonine protein kinase n=2 Tax=Mycobacterium nebraskense TaxID=244292 RepID=A0A1X2A1G9_9MYCO|nr:serine/threonine-protein kinase [Mycobacterium nebraskense]MBI2696039.1 serine/threonine protein kinase [Mycobacterium nebraskense]MCV7116460.1 serine/threonine protein kinase [Mycobacterium nebraskense]ORW34767.1 protein kinase [Mycobacterium nebraskense]
MTSRFRTRFGPYELRSLIGTGATGETYRAYDTVKDRTVAVKLLPAEMAAEPGFQQRFRRECTVAARLQEPHVIPVDDFGEIDGVFFVDMQLVEGGSLKDLLRERGPLEPSRAASITAQVARALDAAHAAGLVHLGVRPENVLLTPDHFAYLVDFGIAHADGSRAYIAPERFTTGRVGPQTDVYSLACLLYECLTGQPPFESTDPEELKSAHMLSPAPRPSIMRRGIGRAFDDVIARGMAKQRTARFASAGELARAASDAVNAAYEPVAVSVGAEPLRTRPFEAVYPNSDDTGYSPYPPSAAPEPPTPGRPFGGRAPLVVTGAAVVLVIAGLIVALVSALSNGGSPPPQAAKTTSPAPSSAPPPKTPTLSRPVQGADGLGFVGETARCDPGNPPAAVVRTAKSLAVVCQNLSGSYYYRGERIRDGAHIELSNAERVGDGFDVTNPVDGVLYEVRPNRLRIISGEHVDSSEPVLQYATAS